CLTHHINHKWKENRCLNDLSILDMARALYEGYEVEETFKVGDWVKDTSTNAVIKIKDRQHRNNINDPRYSTVRHATPEEIAEEKQRRWWAKHGREVWELRENDILYYDDEFKEVEEVAGIGAIMLSSERVYLPIETIKNKYSVACFADDRKDVK